MNTVLTPHARMRRRTHLTVLATVPFLALGLAGCSNDTAGPETGTDVEDIQEGDVDEGGDVTDATEPYHGPYDEPFKDNVDAWVDQDVTVSARLDEILTDQWLTIAGTDDTTVDALLVLHPDPVAYTPGDVLEVTGTVHGEFVLRDVEEELGTDLDDEMFRRWEGEPYISATSIEQLD
jgi:hypothetical protein